MNRLSSPYTNSCEDQYKFVLRELLIAQAKLAIGQFTIYSESYFDDMDDKKWAELYANPSKESIIFDIETRTKTCDSAFDFYVSQRGSKTRSQLHEEIIEELKLERDMINVMICNLQGSQK